MASFAEAVSVDTAVQAAAAALSMPAGSTPAGLIVGGRPLYAAAEFLVVVEPFPPKSEAVFVSE